MVDLGRSLAIWREALAYAQAHDYPQPHVKAMAIAAAEANLREIAGLILGFSLQQEC